MHTEIELIDRIPASAWRQLHAFIGGASRLELQPADWRLFYEFVTTCHEQEAGLTRELLSDFLAHNGFSESVAAELARVYLHGRALLVAGGVSQDRVA